MEYAQKGDLYTLLKEHRSKKKYISEKDLWQYALQILAGIQYLHMKSIIHRDLKCLNIFLTSDSTIKIGDMGVSEILPNGMTQQGSRVGTPLFLAPELVKNYQYDHKIDMWAFGCAIYHLACLETPF